MADNKDKSNAQSDTASQSTLDSLAPNAVHGRLLTLETRKGNVVPFGSITHAALLGLKVAAPNEEYVCEGWTLIEIPLHARDNWIRRQLKSKVDELLTTPVTERQSEKPFEPNYAPPLFSPKELGDTRLIQAVAT